MTAGPTTSVRLCGALALEVDGRDVVARLPGGQAQALLAYLLASPGFAARRDELVEAVLPGRPSAEAQAALRPLLSRLRRAIAPAGIEGRERVRLLLPEPVAVDVRDAEASVSAARAAVRDQRWEDARADAETALDRLRPGVLPELAGDWALAHRRHGEELELEALEALARSGVALGGPDLAVAERASRELIARSPFRERGHHLLMQALAAEGNAAEALRVYDDLRVLLREELGTAPAAELQALHGRLVGGAAPAGGTTRAPASVPEPVRPAPLPRALAPDHAGPLVGRDGELERLRAAWGAARAGATRLVLLAGEPGIGKSRLARALAHEVHGEGRVLYASCRPEALIAYQPLVEALRHHALAAAPLALRSGGGELARLVPELVAGPVAGPQPEDPATRRFRLFEEVAAAFAVLSRPAPVLLVLDDLHWADPATLHLLGHLLRSPHEAALLVLGTFRGAEVGDAHPLAALAADLRRERLAERIALPGLAEREVGRLIARHAGHEAPPALVRRVHDHTDGNPFFVEEVLRDLVQRGGLLERDGRWTATLPAGALGVPDGVRDVLRSRLARLSEPCRRVLTTAAVLGREFPYLVLEAMTDDGPDAVIAALEEAVAAQLVVEADGPGGTDHAFTHALVRETLYASLGGPRRRRMHAAAARALEGAAIPAPIGILARHHRLAGEAGDPTAAVDASMRAGARAADLSAWEEAATHWEGALEILSRRCGHEAERARLLLMLADLMAVTGDLDRQIDDLERALAIYECLGDAERAAQTHSRLGMAHALIDSIHADHLDVHRAFEHFAAARPVLAESPRRKPLGHLETGVATARSYAMRVPEGLEAAARAMEIGTQTGDEVLWAGAAEAYAWHAIVAGRLDEGFAMLERAFAAADRHRRPFLAFMGSQMHGQMLWGIGAPDDAQARFERLAELPYVGEVAYRRQIADGVGRCHLARGEVAEARRLLPEARPTWITHALAPLLDLWDGEWEAVEALAARVLSTSRRTGNRWDEWAALHLAARVAGRRGDHARGVALMEEALVILVDGGAGYFELWLRPDLARVRASSGALEEAHVQVERCRAVMGAEDWRGRAGTVALAEAVVLSIEDRMDAAEPCFEAARAVFARHGLAFDEADALHMWGRALLEAGEGRAAQDRLEQALAQFTRAHAGPVWHERVRGDLRRLR